jgi:hypothetical protein
MSSRCSQIMGRNEQDELTAAQIFYPCMQCADIFFLKVHIFVFSVIHSTSLMRIYMLVLSVVQSGILSFPFSSFVYNAL